jgi:hypothetical protein
MLPSGRTNTRNGRTRTPAHRVPSGGNVSHTMLSLLARRRSWKELPEAARRLGLQYAEATYRHELGTFEGTIRDRRVLVEPDHPAIRVYYQSRLEGLDLFTWSPSDLRRPEVTFDSGNADFDRRFRKRIASPAVAQAMCASHELLGGAAALARRPCVAEVAFDTTRCSVFFGERGFWVPLRFIRARELEDLLPVMLALVERLEAACASVPAAS